jgi:hypothetical protein
MVEFFAEHKKFEDNKQEAGNDDDRQRLNPLLGIAQVVNQQQ